MRGKEEAHDYRYFPDPDLLPVVVDASWVESARKSLPELPDDKQKRFVEQYGLPPYDAGVLTTEIELADYFEHCVKEFPQPKPVSNWVMGPLLGLLNTTGKTISQSPVKAIELASLLKLMDQGVISGTAAKTVFEKMAATGKPPQQIIEEDGLAQVSDASAIEDIVNQVLAKNPKEVAAYREGKTKLMGFFVGQVMKESRGKANPQIVNQLVKQKLDG
jgi:aspartyl-tRNA(Asn)/glutamyl-tRNA(Gln) amidotransferase subunit B